MLDFCSHADYYVSNKNRPSYSSGIIVREASFHPAQLLSVSAQCHLFVTQTKQNISGRNFHLCADILQYLNILNNQYEKAYWLKQRYIECHISSHSYEKSKLLEAFKSCCWRCLESWTNTWRMNINYFLSHKSILSHHPLARIILLLLTSKSSAALSTRAHVTHASTDLLCLFNTSADQSKCWASRAALKLSHF